jgi:hypothetical protein
LFTPVFHSQIQTTMFAAISPTVTRGKFRVGTLSLSGITEAGGYGITE